MRFWLYAGLGFVCTASLPAQSVFRVAVGPGLTVTGDFNEDGLDDVLVIGRDLAGRSQTFFGSKTRPYLVAGPAWTFPMWWDISDSPVYHGGLLYVPINIRFQSVTEIHRFKLVNGRWTVMGRAGIYINTTHAGINSLKIAPTSRDLDGDKQPDILAVWGEAILQKGRTFHAAYVSRTRVHNESKVLRIPLQPVNTEVADVHVSHSIGTVAGAEEYIVVLSGPYLWSNSGLGVLTIGKSLGLGKGIFGVGMPPLLFGGQIASMSASCYGRFGRNPRFATPLLHMQSGPAIIVDPGFVSPYLTGKGEVLNSSQHGVFLDDATADYDGDKIDEVVLAENYPSPSATLVYIGDPTTKRKYAQIFNLAAKVPQANVYHGAKGDFNGDGDPDLVLSYSAGSNGYLALFHADRSAGAGKPALKRVY